MQRILGADGVELCVRAEGPMNRPAIILVHGWSQSLHAWDAQLDSDLAERFRLVAYDLRGHGRSEAPPAGPEHYGDGRLWADDLAAIIEATTPADEAVVLVGWSYGGFVLCDYLRHRGSDRVAGVCFVSASINADAEQVPTYLAAEFVSIAERAASASRSEAEAAIREFVSMCTVSSLPSDVYEAVVAENLLTRPDVRAALGDRIVQSDDVVDDLTVPVRIIQGTADPIVLEPTADYISARCPTATVSRYHGVGHIPMLEAIDRFNAELAEFALHAAEGR